MENFFLKKLQVKAGNIVRVVDAMENAPAIFGEIPCNIRIYYDLESTFDVLIIFTKSKAQLMEQIKGNFNNITAKTVFWIFYPKKSSKLNTDLDLMKSWEELSIHGLSPCASVSVNEIWTGLRLKLESSIKPSGLSNAYIKSNPYGNYINPDTKSVIMPEDLSVVLNQHPIALNFYNSLAYSHRKEYVLWILSAKQEKTRQSRIEKTLVMLGNKKKNPSAKD